MLIYLLVYGKKEMNGKDKEKRRCTRKKRSTYQRPIQNHKKSSNTKKEISDRAREEQASKNLGIAYQSLADYQKAIEYHEKHLKIAKEIGDQAGEGTAYGNLGNAYQSLGDSQKAIEYHEKKLKCAKEIEILGPQDDEFVIVPDGALCFAPRAAVIESIRIRTVPSLTSYQLILSVPEGYHKKTGALLIGNPCLKELKTPLDDLPCAQEEVQIIASILNITPLIGTQATKAQVMKRMSSVGLIHIAAHGNELTGEIALSPNPGWTSKYPQEEDFILKMSDVQAANLRARLVVLSCCHSGRGGILKGEGVVDIARAFLAAGARSVLVALWAVDDEATMVFMKCFYQYLKKGKTASVAVHQSKKSLRESEEFSEMRFWAPFQLIGDDVKIEFEPDDDVKE